MNWLLVGKLKIFKRHNLVFNFVDYNLKLLDTLLLNDVRKSQESITITKIWKTWNWRWWHLISLFFFELFGMLLLKDFECFFKQTSVVFNSVIFNVLVSLNLLHVPELLSIRKVFKEFLFNAFAVDQLF